MLNRIETLFGDALFGAALSGDGQTQDGQTQDGQTQDGQTQDGQTQDGQTQDGQTQDGQTQDTELFFRPGEQYYGRDWTSHYERVLRTGLELPPSRKVTNKKLKRLLWTLIDRLAELRVYLSFTNHLKDRLLYEKLVEETLHDLIEDRPSYGEQIFAIGLVNFFTPDGVAVFLKYYADNEARSEFAERFPEMPVPPAEKPPSSRDMLLPKPTG